MLRIESLTLSPVHAKVARPSACMQQFPYNNMAKTQDATKETRKHRSKEGSRTTAASPPYGTAHYSAKPPFKFPTPA